MDVTFMNFEKIKKSDTHRLLLSFWDKLKIKRQYNYVALSKVRIYDTWKKIKKAIQK